MPKTCKNAYYIQTSSRYPFKGWIELFKVHHPLLLKCLISTTILKVNSLGRHYLNEETTAAHQNIQNHMHSNTLHNCTFYRNLQNVLHIFPHQFSSESTNSDSSVAQVDTMMHNLSLPKVDILIVDTEGADPAPRNVGLLWGSQLIFSEGLGKPTVLPGELVDWFSKTKWCEHDVCWLGMHVKVSRIPRETLAEGGKNHTSIGSCKWEEYPAENGCFLQGY